MKKTVQFGRTCTLPLGKANGEALSFSEFWLQFTVTHGTTQTPNLLANRIFNLSQATAQIISQQYAWITLSAGYKPNGSTIFAGEIQQIRIGRINPTDTCTDIFATKANMGYAEGARSQTLAEGWTHEDIHREITAAMSAGVSIEPGRWVPIQPTRGTARDQRCYMVCPVTICRFWAAIWAAFSPLKMPLSSASRKLMLGM